MGLLWLELDAKAQANNLRNVLHDVSRILDSASDTASRYLECQGEQLVLYSEGPLWVDLEAFELANETLREALEEEPSYEGARAGLMCLHALSGQPQEALGQYERLREVLSRGLGKEPSTPSKRLYEEIKAGSFPIARRSSRAGSVSEESTETGKHNLPCPKTSFVVRKRELVEVKRALAMTRLSTLTGTGGSGKTRRCRAMVATPNSHRIAALVLTGLPADATACVESTAVINDNAHKFGNVASLQNYCCYGQGRSGAYQVEGG
jgi:hypothetical protein